MFIHNIYIYIYIQLYTYICIYIIYIYFFWTPLQDYDPKELIVVDTGPEPSAFFSELRDDPRVIYRHFVVADSRLDLPEGWRKGAPVYFGISNLEKSFQLIKAKQNS